MDNVINGVCKFYSPIQEAVLSRVTVCDPLIAGITGSNRAEGMNIRLLCLLCVV
jgi:hypothetical protein